MLDFLYIGPPKSGSTFLYKVMSSNQDIFIPNAKDIYFWDRYYDKGINWYESYFTVDEASKASVKGEICHDYIFSKEAAERIYKYNKNMKFIGIFRTPIERTISHYFYSLRVGNVKNNINLAMDNNSNIIECSLCADNLAYYIELFGKENFLVINFNDLSKNTDKILKDISNFLEVPNEFLFDREKKVNPRSVSHFPFLTKGIRRFGRLMRDMGGANLVGAIKNSPVLNILYKKSNVDKKKIMSEIPDDKIQILNTEKEKMKRLFPEVFHDW